MSKVKIRVIFDLSIKLPNIELKNPNITIQDFLDIDNKMAESLKHRFKASHRSNLFELIIKGEINEMIDATKFYNEADPKKLNEWFNVKVFIESLKKLQINHDIEWNGFIETIEPQTGIDREYVYSAPEFESEEVGYFLTRQGSKDHEGWQHHERQFEADERNYQEGRTNEDGDWVDY